MHANNNSSNVNSNSNASHVQHQHQQHQQHSGRQSPAAPALALSLAVPRAASPQSHSFALSPSSAAGAGPTAAAGLGLRSPPPPALAPPPRPARALPLPHTLHGRGAELARAVASAFELSAADAAAGADAATAATAAAAAVARLGLGLGPRDVRAARALGLVLLATDDTQLGLPYVSFNGEEDEDGSGDSGDDSDCGAENNDIGDDMRDNDADHRAHGRNSNSVAAHRRRRGAYAEWGAFVAALCTARDDLNSASADCASARGIAPTTTAGNAGADADTVDGSPAFAPVLSLSSSPTVFASPPPHALSLSRFDSQSQSRSQPYGALTQPHSLLRAPMRWSSHLQPHESGAALPSLLLPAALLSQAQAVAGVPCLRIRARPSSTSSTRSDGNGAASTESAASDSSLAIGVDSSSGAAASANSSLVVRRVGRPAPSPAAAAAASALLARCTALAAPGARVYGARLAEHAVLTRLLASGVAWGARAPAGFKRWPRERRVWTRWEHGWSADAATLERAAHAAAPVTRGSTRGRKSEKQ